MRENDKEKEWVSDNFISLLKVLEINWKLLCQNIRLIKKMTHQYKMSS